MTILAFYQALQTAKNIADVEEALSEFEMKYRREMKWIPLGGRENNKGTVEVSGDTGRSLVERLTNGIDAILELEHELHKGTPICRSPKEAASAWLNVPDGGLSDMTNMQRRTLAQKVTVSVLPGDGKNLRTVEVRDFGIGLTPDQMPRTILSLNESNEEGRHARLFVDFASIRGMPPTQCAPCPTHPWAISPNLPVDRRQRLPYNRV